MSTLWQRIKIKIPKTYTPAEREEIGKLIAERIVDRTTNENKDADGKRFAAYSKAYVKSLDFKIAGKSKGDINLKLSGDMLGALDVLNTKPGEVVIGFEKGSDENAKADGNIRGTYGQSKSIGPKRNFLGITDKELRAILKENPPSKEAEFKAETKKKASETNPVKPKTGE